MAAPMEKTRHPGIFKRGVVYALHVLRGILAQRDEAVA